MLLLSTYDCNFRTSIFKYFLIIKIIMDINLFFKNPTKDCDQSSPIPLITKKQPCILGIDEAGRGPFLGILY